MAALFTQRQFENFTWTDILHPERADLDVIAQDYGLDLFQIKDSLEVGHLPKIEKHEHYTFMILRAHTAQTDQRVTTVTELSNKIAFFYNHQKLITIHRSDFEFLKIIRPGFSNTEELLVYLIYKMVETFARPSEHLSKKVDYMERTIFLKGNRNISLEDLYFQKTETRISKNLLLLTQTVVNQLDLTPSNRSAIQDVKDQLVKLLLTYEEAAEDSGNLLKTYMSVIDQKRNEVMKLLTVFSAFFLPLTFIVGIYGMNFDNMPELRWANGYFMTLGIMALVALLIFLWFRKKKIL